MQDLPLKQIADKPLTKALPSEEQTNAKNFGQTVIHNKVVELLQRLKSESDLGQINKIIETIENLKRLSSNSFE